MNTREPVDLIDHVEISNFKSIRNIKFDCKKINILIGEPNTGKSNILEALSLLSFPEYGPMNLFVRMNSLDQIFHDQLIDYPIEIRANHGLFSLSFKGDQYRGLYSLFGRQQFSFSCNIDEIPKENESFNDFFKIGFYRFKPDRQNIKHARKQLDFLYPPFGENLFRLLSSRKALQDEIYLIFERFGLKLVLKISDQIHEIVKMQDDKLYSYPYNSLSDSLQRIIFYLVAILSNQISTIIFEEPASGLFPYYCKFLAEKIALQVKNNQYFISTHDPYFLLSIIEKTNVKEINIMLTHLKDHQTKVKILKKSELKKLLDAGADIFFEIDRFLE
ncbi:MAG: AAA family ATPase [Candidatus Helarchaeales archaeon]